jgi:DNA invertase Pin-like site-specific DNA recombinase
MAQELGIALLIARDVRLVTASGDDLTASDDPTRIMMRQIAGAFAQYEKARLVGKLRSARERKRAEVGKCEGRKSHAEMNPKLVAQAKRLRRVSPKTGERRSLREVSVELEHLGYRNVNGRQYHPKSVLSMVS